MAKNNRVFESKQKFLNTVFYKGRKIGIFLTQLLDLHHMENTLPDIITGDS
jgi:hypothetical protein